MSSLLQGSQHPTDDPPLTAKLEFTDIGLGDYEGSDSGSFVEVGDEESLNEQSCHCAYFNCRCNHPIQRIESLFSGVYAELFIATLFVLYGIVTIVGISILIGNIAAKFIEILRVLSIIQLVFLAIFVLHDCIQLIFEYHSRKKCQPMELFWFCFEILVLGLQSGIQYNIYEIRAIDSTIRNLVIFSTVGHLVLIFAKEKLVRDALLLLRFMHQKRKTHMTMPEHVVDILGQFKDKYAISGTDLVQLNWVIHIIMSHKLYTGVLEFPGGEKPKFHGIDEETRDWIVGTFSKAPQRPRESVSEYTYNYLEAQQNKQAEEFVPEATPTKSRNCPEESNVEVSVAIANPHQRSNTIGSYYPNSTANEFANLLVSTPRRTRRRTMEFMTDGNLKNAPGYDDGVNDEEDKSSIVHVDHDSDMNTKRRMSNNRYSRGRTTTGGFCGVDFQSLRRLYGDSLDESADDQNDEKDRSNVADTAVSEMHPFEGKQIQENNNEIEIEVNSQENSTQTATVKLNDFEASRANLESKIYLGTGELVRLNQALDDWEFDIFELCNLTAKRPLSFVLCSVFMKNDLYSIFHIDETAAMAFFTALEDGYNVENPFHNRLHAADVLQSMHHFCTHNLMRNNITNNDLLAAMVAAAIHDYQHPGRNNAFLIAKQDPLAIRYNDRSVLENMHVSAAFELINDPIVHRNIFANLGSVEQFAEVRETIIQMVLATDMTHHFQTLDKFKSHVLQAQLHVPYKTERRMSGGAVGLAKIETGLSNGTINVSAGAQNSDSIDGKSNDIPSLETRRTLLQMSLHCADVSNPAKPPAMCQRWAKLVQEEFFMQGDEEKRLGLPIGMFMDRTKPSMHKCQIGFVSVIAKPLFTSYCKFLTSLNVLEYIEENLAYWQQKQAQEEQDTIRYNSFARRGGSVDKSPRPIGSPVKSKTRRLSALPSLRRDLGISKYVNTRRTHSTKYSPEQLQQLDKIDLGGNQNQVVNEQTDDTTIITVHSRDKDVTLQSVDGKPLSISAHTVLDQVLNSNLNA